MKKLVTVLLLLLAWYFAGMNRQPYVMAAVLCGIIFVALSFVLTRILRRRLTADIPKQKNIIYKNTQAEFIVTATNKSRLPVNKYKLTLKMKYRGGNTATVKKLSGNACPKSDNDDNSAVVYFAAPYSGIIDAELTRLRVYDYFMIFSSSRKLRGKTGGVAVLPTPRKMNIKLPPFGTYTNEPVAESFFDKPGEDHSEIRLIREYREGDLTRHIHRNYSAKTEKLWVKEYQRENDFIFDMYIDSSCDHPLSTEDRDAFYEMVSAIIHNLMENDIILRIHYYNREKGGIVLHELSDPEKTDEFIILLLKADSFCSKEEFLNVCNIAAIQNAMILTTQLEWSFCGRPVYKFEKKNVCLELVNRYFDLT